METILQTGAAQSVRSTAAQSVRSILGGPAERTASVRTGGTCPSCGSDLVSNCYYISGRGYLILHECEASVGPESSCQYRKVL